MFFSLFSAPSLLSAQTAMSPALVITCPPIVNESAVFTCTITSNGSAIDNVTVEFDGNINLTNSLGQVQFTASRVLPYRDNNFTIIASKHGYLQNSTNISILDVPQVLPSVMSSNIVENTTFVVTVVDDEGVVVENVTITYLQQEYFTDVNGRVTLKTPCVNKTHVVNIERDKKAITYNGGVAYFPYLDTTFVEIALSIPVTLKVVFDGRPSRKVIFRKLALNMGLPTELATKPKDATQYSSGSSKVLIDSVRNHVVNYQSLSRKKASMLVQDVLNLIASEIGVPIGQQINRELEIDLKPTKDLVSRLE